MSDLSALEYPRHLHKTHGAYLHVDTPEQAAAALADGWCVHVPPDPPVDAVTEPAPVAVPAVKGRRSKR